MVSVTGISVNKSQLNVVFTERVGEESGETSTWVGFQFLVSTFVVFGGDR